jgi:hypothetical protein
MEPAMTLGRRLLGNQIFDLAIGKIDELWRYHIGDDQIPSARELAHSLNIKHDWNFIDILNDPRCIAASTFASNYPHLANVQMTFEIRFWR